MTTSLLVAQLLNGLQYGVLLFAVVTEHTASFMLGLLAAVVTGSVLGWILEKVAISKLYRRDHLDHVLATFGLVMFFNEVVRMTWGPQPMFVSLPESLSGTIDVMEFSYPIYRFLIIVVGLIVAVASQWLIHKTRLGMLIRAGSVNPQMVGALGVNIRLLNTLLFVLGSALAALAGAMAGPILSVQSGMGEPVLITALVVIVIGGIGSVQGALYASLIVGLVDTLGRSYLPILIRQIADRDIASAAAPALASMLVYLLMAVTLAFRPQGLFPANKDR